MPKIRGIKPELWTDENFVELSPLARLLWIGLWNFACDNGHVQNKPKQIKMRILPTDAVDCDALLDEIEGQRLIERTASWITIPNLSHHQKPHRRWWSVCEKKGCVLPDGATSAPSNRGTTVAPPKANRGATADGDGDGDGELKVIVKTPLSDKSDDDTIAAHFEAFWDAYDKKVGRKVAAQKYRVALRKRGVTPELLLQAATDYINSLRAQRKHPAFTKNAATWLNGEHWNDDLEAVAPEPLPEMSRMDTHLALVDSLRAEEQQPMFHHRQIGS
ncbi:MAG: hypothetical protein EOP24_39005 [Hyphomicrobiales bacterium]|nr:MAG: hypothetical protein EOP24_39005 [Hyphomicrobiales bacterium]